MCMCIHREHHQLAELPLRFHPDKFISTLPPDEDDYQVQFYCFLKIRELNRSQKVTVLSPKGNLVAVAGCHDVCINLPFLALILKLL